MTNPLDTAAFTLPPQVARMDAVRKLASRLIDTLGLGETAADTIANAVVDPAAVRNALTEPLPALTARRDSHLQIIPTQVWAPWVTPPADEIPRYGSRKRYPAADPSIPAQPTAQETRDGLTFSWKSPADRAWHLKDNEELYDGDVHAQRLRLFPEKGGIITPLVTVPQTETFTDGSQPLHLLRVVDGRRRYYEIQRLLAQFVSLDEEGLARHFGPGLTPDIFQAALERDRTALGKVVNAVRTACAEAGDGNDFQQLIGVHYLATGLSLPAYIVVGTVDPVSSEVRPVGSSTSRDASVDSTLSIGLLSWHSGSEARLVATGQQEHNGLLLPEAAVDSDLIDVAAKRLRARGVPKGVVEFGEGPKARAAARFVWWCRAIEQLGGTPATAVAAFARHTEGSWPQVISRPLLACASHLMEEDRDTVYPPGDYRDPETRPDSLSLLVADAANLFAVAGVTSDGPNGVLVHPRFRNAAHIALAHLALIGALPAENPLPERITGHVRLLSHVAICWGTGQAATFVRPGGAMYSDSDGRTVPIDERTLSRADLPWPRSAPSLAYLTPPTPEIPFEATHVFKIQHDVVYAIPSEPLDEDAIDSTPEAIAQVVRRWFPDATGVVLTDWQDKFITGVMVGSVYVRLFDRRAEQEDARTRGVWYTDGRPSGTKDVIDWDAPGGDLPTGILLGAAEHMADGSAITWISDVEYTWIANDLDDGIVNEVGEALEAQKEAGVRDGEGRPSVREIPVLRLPALKK